MLDRLPNELLLDILELAAPLDMLNSNDEIDRTQTLSSCCLVNRAVCAVATPLLWRAVDIPGDEATALTELSAQTNLTHHTKSLEACELTPSTLAEVGRLGAAFPHLIKLALLAREDLPEQPSLNDCGFIMFINLRHLVLLDFVLDLRVPPCLPHLQTLDMDICISTPSSLKSLLNPTTLPALEVLKIEDVSQQYSQESFFPTLLPDFLDRLSFLEIAPFDLDDIPATVLQHPVPKLMQYYLTIRGGPALLPSCRIASLTIRLLCNTWGDACRSALTSGSGKSYQVRFASPFRPADWPDVRSVYLPDLFLTQAHLRPSSHCLLQSVLAESQGDHVFAFPYTTRNFLDYAKELKAKQATDGGGNGAA